MMKLAALVKTIFGPDETDLASKRILEAIQNGNATAVAEEYKNPEIRSRIMACHYYGHVEAAVQTGNADVFKALFAIVNNNPFHKMTVSAVGPMGSSAFERPSFRELAIWAQQPQILDIITNHMPAETMVATNGGTYIPVRAANELALKR